MKNLTQIRLVRNPDQPSCLPDLADLQPGEFFIRSGKTRRELEERIRNGKISGRQVGVVLQPDNQYYRSLMNCASCKNDNAVFFMDIQTCALHYRDGCETVHRVKLNNNNTVSIID